MSWVSVARAVLVRALFAMHGLMSIWLLYTVTREARYWYMASGVGLQILEMAVTLAKKGGKEWKWFCPSVFIYLVCVVPPIWFLELHEMYKRIEKRRREIHNVTMATNGCTQSRDLPIGTNDTEEELRASGTVMGMNFEIHIPVKLRSEEWIKAMEQLLLLLLILGRWLMPKGKLTHDQLSQLLLVYIGTAADIVEFFDAFKEDAVRYEPHLCMSILGMWSFSLIQFSLVLTAARARRDQTGLVPTKRMRRREKKRDICCSADVYGIVISILLQDAPFLVLRMLLIFKYNVLSYTNMFFTSKNTIVIILLIYRLIVIHTEKRREVAADGDAAAESELLKERNRRLVETASLSPSSCSGNSRIPLVNSGSSYSNGFYVPSRSTTPCREDGSVGSVGSIGRVGGGGGGGSVVGGGGGGVVGGGALWNSSAGGGGATANSSGGGGGGLSVKSCESFPVEVNVGLADLNGGPAGMQGRGGGGGPETLGGGLGGYANKDLGSSGRGGGGGFEGKEGQPGPVLGGPGGAFDRDGGRSTGNGIVAGLGGGGRTTLQLPKRGFWGGSSAFDREGSGGEIGIRPLGGPCGQGSDLLTLEEGGGRGAGNGGGGGGGYNRGYITANVDSPF